MMTVVQKQNGRATESESVINLKLAHEALFLYQEVLVRLQASLWELSYYLLR